MIVKFYYKIKHASNGYSYALLCGQDNAIKHLCPLGKKDMRALAKAVATFSESTHLYQNGP